MALGDLQRAWDAAVQGAETRSVRRGYSGDGAGNVTVANKPGWYYVRIGGAGSFTVTEAKNHPKLGVPPDPDLPIRLRREQGILTIYGDAPLSTGSVPTMLGDLADVITGGEADHQALQFRAADGMWLNQYLALYTGPGTTVVEAAGAITVSGGSHWRVQAGIGTSATIENIATDQAGHRIVVRPVPGHSIILQSGTGNLSLHNGDCQLASENDALELMYLAGPPARWIELGRSIAADGGQTPYVGGLGIAVTGQTIDVDLASPSGLTFLSDKLALDANIAGNGLLMDASKNLHINLAAVSGLEIVSDQLRLRDDVAGAGLIMTNKIMDIDLEVASGLTTATGKLKVDLGRGLELAGNALEVNEAFAFTWTGTHTFQNTATFNVDPQVNANLDFIGGAHSITSSGSNNLTLAPGGNLILADGPNWRSVSFLDSPVKITGFRQWELSGDRYQLTISTLKVDELHARVFVADETRVSRGENFLSYSYGFLANNAANPAEDSVGFTIPAGTTYPYTIAGLRFEDSPAITGAIFVAGDWIRFRIVDTRGGGLIIANVEGTVAGYVDNGDGTQDWNFTIVYGPDHPGPTTAEFEVKAGAFAVDFGKSGQSFIHETVLETSGGPFISIQSWTGSNPTDGTLTEHARMGKLDSVNDVDFAFAPNTYGFYSNTAYLKGVVRTAETVMDDAGLSLFYPETDTGGLEPLPGRALIGWWPDLNNRTATPPVNLFAHTYFDLSPYRQDTAVLKITRQSTSNKALLALYAEEPTGEILNGSSIFLYSDDLIQIFSGTLEIGAHAVPDADLTRDLGTASRRWRNLYVNQLFVSGSISGDTLSGAEWEYPGSMVIDANSTSPTTVSITNQNTGTASLSVEGNITLGGTVDGVDIAAHDSNPSAHHALATAGDGITITGQLVSVRLAPTSGLSFLTGQLQIADTLAGAGLLMTSKVLSVRVGNGIEIVSDLVSVNLAAVSGLAFTSGELMLSDSVAGAGLGITGKVLSVNVGNGLEIVTDVVAVDLSTTSGLEFVAGDLQIADSIAGAGLSIASKILAVSPGLGIELAGDTVAVDLAGHSGLQFSGNALQLGTPDNVAAGVSAAVSGTTHRHTVISTSDGSAISVNTLLHATSVGGLILGNLQVRGAVDITDGGDLIVGPGATPALYVNNTGDPSTANVGINRIPDPQFSLDVNGPLRADYLIGSHAIQVKDAVLIAHFDGLNLTNAIGEPNGHFGQVALYGPNDSGSSVIFRPGLFGKALQVAAGVTNQVINPSVETNTNLWAALNNATITRTLEEAYAGSYSLKVETTAVVANKGAVYTEAGRLGASTTYTVSCYVKGDSKGNNLYLRVRSHDDSANLATTTFEIEGSEGWKLVQATFTSEAAPAALNLRIRVHDDAAAALTYYVDAVQLETGAYATPYCDGSLKKHDNDGGHSWSSTAHGSTSVRASVGRISYPIANLPYGRGTVMVWARAPWGIAAASRAGPGYLWNAGNAYVRVGTNGRCTVLIHGVTFSPQTVIVDDTDWHHYALTWDGYEGTATLYLDGVAAGSGTGLVAAVYTNVLYVGSRTGGNDPWDGWLDDFATIGRELPADEIRSIYESQAPIFAESSVFAFRATPKGLVWADDEGLWMRDYAGNSVLGAYGGEAVTKSWGGALLGQGDILFGRYGTALGGWLHFDRDGSASQGLLKLGYADKDVFTLTSSAAKLQAANLEITNASSQEILGVFATAPSVSDWAGLGAGVVAAGDVVIGDMARSNILWWDDSAAVLTVGVYAPVATGANILISSTSINLRWGSNERVRLFSGGLLRISNSAGQPVFTFDANAGAEFSRPLTLKPGTSGGGIYQGTGTFDSPTTGLKIYSTGTAPDVFGKLSTYNLGVEQITLDTDGKFKAGGGVVRLDQLGISVEGNITDSINPLHAYVFRDTNGVEYGGLYSHLFPDINGARNLKVSLPQESRPAFIRMEAYSSVGTNLTLFSQVGSNYSAVELTVNPTPLLSLRSIGVINLASASEMRLVNDSTVTSALTGGGVVQITQKSTSGAVPVLAMNQLDLSEEFFGFVGTVAAGNPIDTAALGTYYGKVRVSVNGVFKFLALYNS